MIDFLPEFEKYGRIDQIENIISEYGEKIIGVESDLILNENKKFDGQILLKGSDTKFKLSQFVEFKEKNIKYKYNYVDEEGYGFYLLNPFWCKPYTPITKLTVPVSIWVSGNWGSENQVKTYKEFVAERMKIYQAKWPHIYVLAVLNCRKLFTQMSRKKCLETTVKYYGVDQEKLSSLWGKVNRKMSDLKREWTDLFKQNFETDLAFKKRNKKRIKMKSNVIKMEKRD